MKKANNNEMDRVLRGLAKTRRDDSSIDLGSARSNDNGDAGNHLDADELNSFAEGLVPEPARVRYMAHLADCSNCRRLAVSLKQASGDLSAAAVADKRVGSGFWQRLAALFSPQVLRYAVPALVLTTVIGIGLLVLRQQRGQDFVAQQQTRIPETHSVQPPATGETINPSGAQTSSAPNTTLESKRSTDSSKEKNDAQADESQTAKPEANIGFVANAPLTKEVAPQPLATLEPGVIRTQPLFSPEPKTGAAYDAGQVVRNDDKKVEVNKEVQPAESIAQQRERDEFNVKRSKEGADEQAAPQVGATSGPKRAEALMSARRPAAKAKQDSDNDEIRSVAGKRFRRQGNVWVDSNYESSRATINVARSSEQFRALVADEPGIRTIANQLDGELIVVWKGKAYRIR